MLYALFSINYVWCSSPELLSNDTIRFSDALNYRLIGKGFPDTESPYDRLPSILKGKTRESLWNLSKNSSGLGIRFRSNSPFIAARYELLNNSVMNHMAFTGIKGLDLYCLESDGNWRYVITLRPTGPINQSIMIDNMTATEREYLLYLPLYDGIKSLEIGVALNSTLSLPRVESPRQGGPIVIYGTSITQGGCASRPGMVYSNILSRNLNKECINLGFSGNGRQDLIIAQAMDVLTPSCIIIDCIPNCTLKEVEENTLPFVRHIRKMHPGVPILMMEGPYFPQQAYDNHLQYYLPSKHQAYYEAYLSLLKDDPENLYYLENRLLTGSDREGTVDGIHLTDLGFMRLAEQLTPVISKLLKETPSPSGTRIVAHRGYWDCEGSAQNSLFALRKAAEAGLYGSEFDVLITADTVAIVNHDNTIAGYVIEKTPYEQLKNLKIKNGEQIPTLRQFLEAGKLYPNLQLILELKPHMTPEREKAAVNEVIRQVKLLGMEKQVDYISFSKHICELIHRALPQAQVTILTEKVTPKEAKLTGLTGVDYHYSVFEKNPDYIQSCRDMGLSINVWTVNNPGMIQEFIDQKVDFITTDKPTLAKQIAENQ